MESETPNEFPQRGRDDDNPKLVKLVLPRGTYRALKQTASRRNLPVEKLIRLAVEHELGFDAEVSRREEHILPSKLFLQQLADSLAHVQNVVDSRRIDIERYYLNPSPSLFAHRFLQSLPVPVILKRFRTTPEDDAVILWCNQACEDLLGTKLDVLRGQPADAALGLSAGDAAYAHVAELRRVSYTVRYERFQVRGADIYVSAHRFIVTELERLGRCVGDVSFRADDLTRARKARVSMKTFLAPPRISDVDAHYCERILSNLPLVAVLKDKNHKIRWCNGSFATLAGQDDPSFALGRTSADIFGLPEGNETAYYDSLVLANREASLGSETLPSSGDKRIAVHFPIFGKEAEVEFIGVVSGETAFPEV